MEGNEKLYFHGGMLGAWLPMVTFVIVVVTAAMTGHISLTVFAAGAFVAICVGFLLSKNKKAFDAAVIDGVGDHMLATMTVAFLMAGILSQTERIDPGTDLAVFPDASECKFPSTDYLYYLCTDFNCMRNYRRNMGGSYADHGPVSSKHGMQSWNYCWSDYERQYFWR